MDPLREDLVWRRNAPEAVTYTLKDGDQPVDLTGYAFRLQVRRYPGATGTPLISLGMAASGPGFRIEDAQAGVFVLTPPTIAQLLALPTSGRAGEEQTADLSYDILLVAPDGIPEAFMEGRIILVTGVIR